MSTSTVLVIPAEHREAGNKFFCAIGQDALPGYTFSRKLSASGDDPATHYACHTMASADLLTTLTAIRNGTFGPLVPDAVDWAEWETTETDVLAFGQSLSMHVQGEPQAAPVVFFDSVLSALGLATIDDPL